jgi:hypothetical protein
MKANYIPAALVIVTLFTCQASAGDLGGATAAGRVAGQETGAAQNAADAARRTMPPANPSPPAASDANGAAGVNVNAPGAEVQVNRTQAPGTTGVNAHVQTPSVGANVETRGEREIRGNSSSDRRFQGRTRSATNLVTDNRPDPWRYKWENNRWWYWAPDNRWMWYSDPGGWTYVNPNGGYSTGYGGVTVAPPVPTVPVAPSTETVVPPSTTYYNYPSSGYYYGYPSYRYYYGRPGFYYGGRGWGRGW